MLVTFSFGMKGEQCTFGSRTSRDHAKTLELGVNVLKRFLLPNLYMTFGVSRSEKFFHSLKSAFPDDKIVLLEVLFRIAGISP